MTIFYELRVDLKDIIAQCNERIGVIAIMGNHYNGAYDPTWEISPQLKYLGW